MKKNLFARVALFTIFFWLGMLKIFDLSPATPLVKELLKTTLPFVSPSLFLVMFGVFEVVIGILFLIPKFKKLTLTLFYLHMIATFLPLILVADTVWEDLFVPTLEGQYIIKNIALIALTLYL